MPYENLKEATYIKLFFGDNIDFYRTGLNRAYRDMNRTLWIKDKNVQNRINNRNRTTNFLKEKLIDLIQRNFSNQDEFDETHKELCLMLNREWDELSLGHCQKWINMTLKYWFLLGDSRITNISKNVTFFHIPIDNYVLNGLLNKKLDKAWSKLSFDEYDEYLNLQKLQREKDDPPLIAEIKFFNEYNPRSKEK